MENLKTLVLGLYVLLLLAIIWKGFRMAQRARETNAFEPGTFPGHMSPPKPPSRPKRPKAVEDNWVRDRSKPPPVSKDGYSEEVMVLQGPFKGVGRYDHSVEAWHCFFPRGAHKLLSTRGHRKEIEAWQKFPEYEKI